MFARRDDLFLTCDSDVVVPLQRPPMRPARLTWTTTMTLALVASSAADVLPKAVRREPIEPESLVWAACVALWLVLLGLGAVRRRWVRRWPMPPVTFGLHAMSLPTHSEARKPIWLRYRDVLALGESGRMAVAIGVAQRPQARLTRRFFLETDKRVVAIDEQWFAEPRGADQFFAALRERLNAQPGATEQLLVTERMRRPAAAAMARYPYACQMTIGLMAVLFLNTWLKGALQTPFGLLRWGAMAPALAYRSTEAYRFISANFLHGHWLHVLMNMWALSYLGALIERLLGRARFVILFVCSALAAMLASAWSAGALLSVGASGAIFGLLGAFAVTSRRLRRALPLGLRQPPRWWLSLLAVNVALPLMWPVIDWSAHVAGFATGALLAAGLLGRRRTLPEAPGRALSTAAALLVALCGAALCQAVVRAAAANAAQETKLAEVLLHDRHTTATALNNLAWLWAIDRDSDDEHLEAGTRCAQEAIAREPNNAEFSVTLASLWQRRGEHAAALVTWHQALEQTLQEADMAHEAFDGELHTFAAARALQLVQAWDSMAQATRPAVGHIEREGDRWQVRLDPSVHSDGPLLAYVAGRQLGGARVAVVRLAMTDPLQTVWPLPADLSRALHEVGAERADLVAVVPQPAGHSIARSEHTDGPLGWTLWRPLRLFPALSP